MLQSTILCLSSENEIGDEIEKDAKAELKRREDGKLDHATTEPAMVLVASTHDYRIERNIR